MLESDGSARERRRLPPSFAKMPVDFRAARVLGFARLTWWESRHKSAALTSLNPLYLTQPACKAPAMHCRITRFFLPAVLLTASVVLLLGIAPAPAAETNAPHHAQWESAIAAFETADKTNSPPRYAIELLGSSSIRLWTSAPEQFPGHKIFKRGFGGSHLGDSVAFVERIVIPYAPKIVVLYAGDNDLAAGKSPEQVFGDFEEFVRKIHAALPETRIVFISIKPCPARENILPQVKAANQIIQQFIRKNRRLTYVDIFKPSLTKDGRTRPELYLKDGLHPNSAGYELWAGILKPVLDKADPPRR